MGGAKILNYYLHEASAIYVLEKKLRIKTVTHSPPTSMQAPLAELEIAWYLASPIQGLSVI